jgi:hypothetical protein
MADWTSDRPIPYLGKMGFPLAVVSVTPTVSASPDYSDQDVIGGAMEVANAVRVTGGKAILDFLSLSSKVDIGCSVHVILFKANPSNSTFTDNAALSVNSADYDKLLDVVKLPVGEIVDLGTPNVVSARNLGIVVDLTDPATSLYAVAYANAGTINLASTSDFTFNFGFRQG